MVHYKHDKSGKVGTVYTYKDGFCRVVAYVPGDDQWKEKTKQLRVTENQANAIVARKENYVRISCVGSSSPVLVHSNNLRLLP